MEVNNTDDVIAVLKEKLEKYSYKTIISTKYSVRDNTIWFTFFDFERPDTCIEKVEFKIKDYEKSYILMDIRTEVKKFLFDNGFLNFQYSEQDFFPIKLFSDLFKGSNTYTQFETNYINLHDCLFTIHCNNIKRPNCGSEYLLYFLANDKELSNIKIPDEETENTVKRIKLECKAAVLAQRKNEIEKAKEKAIKYKNKADSIEKSYEKMKKAMTEEERVILTLRGII